MTLPPLSKDSEWMRVLFSSGAHESVKMLGLKQLHKFFHHEQIRNCDFSAEHKPIIASDADL